MRRLAVASLLSLFAVPVAAKPAPPPVAAPVAAPVKPVVVAAPEVVIPPLATGAAKQTQVAATARVVGRSVDGDTETLTVELQAAELSPSASAEVVSVGALAAVVEGKNEVTVCVRRRTTSELVKGTYYGTQYRGRAELAAPFSAAVPTGVAVSAPQECLKAFAQVTHNGAVYAYARNRLGELATPPAPPLPPVVKKVKGKKGAKPTAVAPTSTAIVVEEDPQRREFLGEMMDTTTGLHSLDEALQTRRRVWSRSSEKADIPIKTVAAPRVVAHPWRAMLAGLKTAVPSEKLAEAVPAEFSYLRARRIDTFLRLLDQIDTWITPAVAVVDREFADRGLGQRYQTQLGLERTPLSRLFGPAVLAELGLCTSDAYVREGTDVTVLFRAKDRPLLMRALDGMLDGHRQRHPDLSVRTARIAGLDVRIATTPDGVVRQHRASLGDLEIVSNSAVALERVLQAAQRQRPRLADELDFQYMLARDVGTADDLLGFLGERFIAETVGPRQKIWEARRVMAAAELATPGYAALLYGWMYGRAPRDSDELVRSQLLDRQYLVHHDGTPIEFVPGHAARSKWGTLASLTPIIDLTAPLDFLTNSEVEGYRRFASMYEGTWSEYVDPIALRVSASAVENGVARWTFDLRVLPLLRTRDYRELLRWVGQARFEIGRPPDGVRAVIGIGKDAKIRREGKDLLSLPGLGSVSLDWLGSWGMLGIGDSKTVLAAARSWMRRELPERPSDDSDENSAGRRDEHLLGRLPIYAGVGVKSALGAGLLMTALRELGKKSLGERVTFADAGQHRGAVITDIRLRERSDDPSRDWHLYYALTDDALLFCLDRVWMTRLLDDAATGRLAKEATTKKAGTQLGIDLASPVGGPLWTLLLWTSEQVARQHGVRAEDLANALYHGAPETQSPEAMDQLAMAYFGSRPVTPSGRSYVRGPDGMRDPDRGSRLLPSWPQLPIANAALTRALEKLAGVRTEVSLDDEGAPRPDSTDERASGVTGDRSQSFHGRLTIQLRE